MLGVLENGTFNSGRVTLDPGDMLVAYSDGVTECRNAADEEFETDRLVAAARAVSNASAASALFSLLGTVLDFAASCSPADDLTVLVVRHSAMQAQRLTRSRVKKFPAPHRRSASALRPRNSDRGEQSSE